MLELFDFAKLKLSLSAEFQHSHIRWKDMAGCVEERGQYVLHNIQALVTMWTVGCWRRVIESQLVVYILNFSISCVLVCLKNMSAVKQWNVLSGASALLGRVWYGLDSLMLQHYPTFPSALKPRDCFALLKRNSYYVKSIK